ncbi:succinate-semialdehyde dehydrogenase [Paracoccus halophilus]|uniref:Succinate-semialdehyde dehydrogenase n=1 Tax=Paracoccus halophilus TaxID=376733 RepID=A0A099F1H2_9RHOB|nr:succinate-semialdehyde dehydrogenase [Paracoccus halophilus]
MLTDRELLADRGDFAGDGGLAVRDPATGRLVAKLTTSDATGARAAVDAAQRAFPGWAGMLPQDRAAILHRWHGLIVAAGEDLARIMVAEQGKPISEARGEIDYAASFVQFYAEEALRPNIEGVTSHLPDAEMELWREPVGVAALITPWNFPCAMITRKAAAALGAGCTVVIHPSAETPLSALALSVLARRAGFPEGVVNTVIGDAATIVGEWTADRRVRALSFTGSTEVGRLLYRQSAETVKRLVLELGGHAPFIVFEHADLDRAVAEGIKAKFATSGQDCLGANRFYIHRPVYDEFCRRFAEATQRLTLGPGIEDPDIGPLIHGRQIDKQKAHVADALDKGARLLAGGTVDARGPLFFQPTVLADVPDDAAIMREETFGPVAALTPFDTEAQVYARANASEYGLIAYVHSLDPRRIYRATRALQYGMIAVNRTRVTGAPIPFGGMKQSGIGREGARQGLEAFTEIKYVCRDWA